MRVVAQSGARGDVNESVIVFDDITLDSITKPVPVLVEVWEKFPNADRSVLFLFSNGDTYFRRVSEDDMEVILSIADPHSLQVWLEDPGLEYYR